MKFQEAKPSEICHPRKVFVVEEHCPPRVVGHAQDLTDNIIFNSLTEEYN